MKQTKLNELLFTAAIFGHEADILRLLKAGAEVDAFDDRNNTPLMTAAFHGNLRTVKELIAAGADVNRTNVYGSTPLMAAAQSGISVTNYHNPPTNDAPQPIIQIIEMLLRAGADFTVRNKQRETVCTILKYHYLNYLKKFRILIRENFPFLLKLPPEKAFERMKNHTVFLKSNAGLSVLKTLMTSLPHNEALQLYQVIAPQLTGKEKQPLRYIITRKRIERIRE